MWELVNNCVINVQNIAKVYISGEIMKNFQKQKCTHACKNARLAENIHKSYVGNTGLIGSLGWQTIARQWSRKS